ncbi:MAG: signal peptide peptidase SppA [Bacteroidales bacterium]|nr:signal peptide peptidase SppA [Bacteroidales bacterium]
MKSFLKYTLATITGIILTSIIFFVVLLASLSALVASGDKPVSISENSILVLKAGVELPDRGNDDPFSGIDIVNMTFAPVPGLNDILKDIEKASSDANIKGILIENGLLPSGWATTGEIRNALLKFRESGKFIISYSDYLLTQQCYYLSSAADKIYINPGSMVDFKGLSAEMMFYKNALDKLGVEVQVTRHGKFKGAVEPFILDKLSDENKEQIKAYVGSIWENVISAISDSRGIPADKLNLIADNLSGNIASTALENKLVDGLLYRNELIDTLKFLSGISKEKDLSLVSMAKYTKVPDPNKVVSAKTRIAVIYASGNIVTGKGNESNIGGNYYAEIIRKQRLDTSVKAVVLRVNSPGGSATASDIMWQELELTTRVKPVVISMGNYAASGGYFISAPATKIYASPTTISGSIGVFGLLPNAGELLEKKLGLSTETVNTNKNSDFPSVYRPMNTYEKEIMQKSIENIYSDFVTKVSLGRKKSFESVDSIGQGRVWSGVSAKEIGLVDEIRGLTDAIKGAAELAGIDKYSIRELPVFEDPYTRLLSQLEGELKTSILKKELGESVKYFNMVEEIRDLSGIQARLPYFLEIR